MLTNPLLLLLCKVGIALWFISQKGPCWLERLTTRCSHPSFSCFQILVHWLLFNVCSLADCNSIRSAQASPGYQAQLWALDMHLLKPFTLTSASKQRTWMDSGELGNLPIADPVSRDCELLLQFWEAKNQHGHSIMGVSRVRSIWPKILLEMISLQLHCLPTYLPAVSLEPWDYFLSLLTYLMPWMFLCFSRKNCILVLKTLIEIFIPF